jgi:hypothetical protein
MSAHPNKSGKFMNIDTVKNLHQYYRDKLSRPSKFPAIGSLPPELVEWVIDVRNTDVVQLAEHLETLPRSGLPDNEDLALRLLFFTIVQANLASDVNNRYPNYTLPEGVVANIKRGLSRVLELHPHEDYVAICVQLLYRVKEVEEVLSMAESYPDIFAEYPMLQAMVGFIQTNLGNYDTAVRYLQPLAEHPTLRNLPFVGLSYMTCQHFLGKVPQWPLSFESLRTDTAELEDLVASLPKIEMVEPLAATGRDVVFVAADSVYFMDHARYLAFSMHATNAGKLDLHLHLYSPSVAVLQEIERMRRQLPGMAIGVSAERGPVPLAHAPTYYMTVRFVRAWQVMQRYQRTLCLMDADALFNGDWDRFSANIGTQAEIVLARPEAAPFWEQVPAGFVVCRPTPLGEHFLAKVSQFILRNYALKQTVLFTDQVALSAYDSLFGKDNPAIVHIDSRVVIDLQHTPDSLCWMVTTRKSGNPAYDAARARLERHYA